MSNVAPSKSPPRKKPATRDRDVRQAVLTKVLAEHVADPNVLVVEELGLEHGACRIDITVVNGYLHGYELKSDSDNLLRLPGQVSAYSNVLDRATLVVGEKHLDAATDLLPDWWGIKVASVGARGAVNIDTFRPVENNPNVSAFHLAHLLWKPEAISLLEQTGVCKGIARLNRRELYALLAETIPPVELRRHVREFLKNRTNWRRP